ncbi:hypothetical protein FLBR109950_08375 [Flavobacterium branchiophilum]|uniref:DUF4468 domain-containing protein n=2 Tax=Flavobacterium branchiophilum TaxID=55197 RepID=G2Z2V9_FLABF|nr:hypothetical protein [Flavobacterium branchiophilum]PDS23740.1 hypothetical protein B0A77_10190 [Flavobacterium branchiophilum]CCB70288.1 Hypothetical protein precursor [Flavobacterium branchiophilum FL-15]
MKKMLFFVLFAFQSYTLFAQGLIIGLASGPAAYIPKATVLNDYPLYETVKKFDFSKKKVTIKFDDLRDSLKLKKLACASIELENKSEFNAELGAQVVKAYIDSLCVRSNFIITESQDSEQITAKLEALDCKKTGFMIPNVHGICQIQFAYQNFSKTYCVDIKDGDLNAPVGRMTPISVKKAKKLMVCASIRNAVELFLIDLQNEIKK